MTAYDCLDEEYANVLVKWAEVVRKTAADGAFEDIITTRRLTHVVKAFAVYKNKKLVAFVEIDGAHHYNIEGKLKRKDCLKEFLYNKRYPDIKIFRIRADQCEAIGNRKAGHALATWIIKK